MVTFHEGDKERYIISAFSIGLAKLQLTASKLRHSLHSISSANYQSPASIFLQADHLPLSSAEVKNVWICTITLLIRLHGVVLNKKKYRGQLYLYFTFTTLLPSHMCLMTNEPYQTDCCSAMPM